MNKNIDNLIKQTDRKSTNKKWINSKNRLI